MLISNTAIATNNFNLTYNEDSQMKELFYVIVEGEKRSGKIEGISSTLTQNNTHLSYRFSEIPSIGTALPQLRPSPLSFIIGALGVIFITGGIVFNIWMAIVGGVGLIATVIAGLKEINE